MNSTLINDAKATIGMGKAASGFCWDSSVGTI
jgi:hypothetical protein